MYGCFGVDIGGTTVKIGLFSEQGRLLEKWELPTRREGTPHGLLLDIRDSIANCLRSKGLQKEEILGIGMAAPGPVTADGILHGADNIGWGDVALAVEAERSIGISPVCIGNDARLAALGEVIYGAGRGAKSILMVTLGTGVGGGVVLQGRPLLGESGVAGEIGHMTINPFETEQCSCGKKGCLEQYASATGMVRMAKLLLAEWSDPSLLRQRDALTAKLLWDAAKADDALAQEITDTVCAYLGTALANAVYLVDPEKILLGGGVSLAGEFLLQKVRRAYRSRVFSHCEEKEILLAGLGKDAGIYGAAAMLLQAVRYAKYIKNDVYFYKNVLKNKKEENSM